MRSVSLLAIGVTMLCCCIISAGQNGEAKDLEGDSLGAKYHNDQLGFEISIPSGWYIAESSQLETYAEKGRKDLGEGYKLSKETIAHNKDVENIILGISKMPIGARKNSLFGFSVTKQPSDAITSKMVAEYTKRIFLKDANNRLTKEIAVRKIGGLDFATFDFDVSSDMGDQHVRIFIVNLKSRSLTFALTYWDNNGDLGLMTKAVESIRF